MPNEILLLISVVITYGGLLGIFRFFGETGLCAFNVFATVIANIEVLILVNAFGIEMTLGNVLFASTFLTTDILHELYGKQSARKAVHIGITVSCLFILFSQLWLRFTPSVNDFAMTSVTNLFSYTPRIIFASVTVYALSQELDVWLYNAWWKLTEKLSGSRRAYLWIRNNGSTMISQIVNTVLYTLLAFYGTHSTQTLIEIIISTYAIYFVLSVIDTPIIYIARKIYDKKHLAKKE